MPTTVTASVENRVKSINRLDINNKQRIIVTEHLYNEKLAKDGYSDIIPGGLKPQGVWYSPGKEWINWCTSEMPEWIGRYVYEIKIDHSKTLKINTLKKLDAFDKEYRSNTYFDNYPIASFGRCYSIDWKRVATEYSGIEIVPYRFERRYSMLWLYGWDVASGCVWDKKAIKQRKLIYQFDTKTKKYIAVK